MEYFLFNTMFNMRSNLDIDQCIALEHIIVSIVMRGDRVT